MIFSLEFKKEELFNLSKLKVYMNAISSYDRSLILLEIIKRYCLIHNKILYILQKNNTYHSESNIDGFLLNIISRFFHDSEKAYDDVTKELIFKNYNNFYK